MSLASSNRGFTLLETIVATGILITALAGVAQLFILSTHLARQSGASGAALVAAQDKLESLRGLAFGYDAVGVPITDATLQPSPPASLAENTAPYVDWLDSAGEPHADPGAAVLLRRWRITTLAATAPESITIEVCVFRAGASGDHRSADVCLSTVRTRQP